MLQQKDPHLSSSKTTANKLKRMYWHVRLSGPVLSCCHAGLFLVCGLGGEQNHLNLSEWWNGGTMRRLENEFVSNVLTSWAVFVTSSQSPFATAGHLQQQKERVAPTRRNKKQKKTKKRAKGRENLWHAFVRLLTNTTSNECRYLHCIGPPFILKMLHLTLLSARMWVTAAAGGWWALQKKKEERERHKQTQPCLYLSDRVGLEIFWLSRHDPSQSPHLKCWLLDTTWSYCDTFKNLRNLAKICFFDCDVSSKDSLQPVYPFLK